MRLPGRGKNAAPTLEFDDTDRSKYLRSFHCRNVRRRQQNVVKAKKAVRDERNKRRATKRNEITEVSRNLTKEHLDEVAKSVDTTPAVFTDKILEATVSIKPMLPSSLMFSADIELEDDDADHSDDDRRKSSNNETNGEEDGSGMVDPSLGVLNQVKTKYTSKLYLNSTSKYSKFETKLKPPAAAAAAASSSSAKQVKYNSTSWKGKKASASDAKTTTSATDAATAAAAKKKSLLKLNAARPGRARQSIISNPLLR